MRHKAAPCTAWNCNCFKSWPHSKDRPRGWALYQGNHQSHCVQLQPVSETSGNWAPIRSITSQSLPRRLANLRHASNLVFVSHKDQTWYSFLQGSSLATATSLSLIQFPHLSGSTDTETASLSKERGAVMVWFVTLSCEPAELSRHSLTFFRRMRGNCQNLKVHAWLLHGHYSSQLRELHSSIRFKQSNLPGCRLVWIAEKMA